MIIGIGGVSRAGKTSLARQIGNKLVTKRLSVELFDLDDYVKSEMSLSKVQGIPDWERPNSINWDKLTKALEKSEADIKIVEGIFAVYPASLLAKYGLKIFIELDKKTFFQRRSHEKRWGKEPDWYPEHVWKSYQKYGTLKGDRAEYMIINGAKMFDIKPIIDRIMN